MMMDLSMESASRKIWSPDMDVLKLSFQVYEAVIDSTKVMCAQLCAAASQMAARSRHIPNPTHSVACSNFLVDT